MNYFVFVTTFMHSHGDMKNGYEREDTGLGSGILLF